MDAPVLTGWCEGAHDSGGGDTGRRVGKVDTGVLCLMEGADNAASCVNSLFTLSKQPGPKNFLANLTVDNMGLEVFGRLNPYLRMRQRLIAEQDK